MQRLNTGSTKEDIVDYTTETRPRRLTGSERDDKIDRCQTWYSFFNPETGMRSSRKFECRLKGCPFCGAKRGDILRGRIYNALADGFVYFAQLSSDDADNLISTLNGKEKYIRLPQEDGTEIVFYRASESNEKYGVEIDHTLMIAIDWASIQNIPDGRITSGTLGKDDLVLVPDKGAYQVNVSLYNVSKEDRDAMVRISLRAIAATLSLNPTTVEEIQSAVAKRQTRFEFLMNEANVDFKRETFVFNGKLCNTDWQKAVTHSFSQMLSMNIMKQYEVDQYYANSPPI
jgi:hypothetical protein